MPIATLVTRAVLVCPACRYDSGSGSIITRYTRAPIANPKAQGSNDGIAAIRAKVTSDKSI